MNFKIKKTKTLSCYKFKIYLESKLLYIAKAENLSSMDCYIVLTKKGNRRLLSIEKQTRFLHTIYQVTNKNGSFEFGAVDALNNHYALDISNQRYHIYGHRGKKASIFLGGKQIAYFTLNSLSILGGDEYDLVTDNDVTKSIVFALLLIWDNKTQVNDFGSFNTQINLGYIGTEARKFNNEWKPNME